MIGADGILQCAIALPPCPLHRRQPAGTRAKRRIGELFLLCFKLLARRYNVSPSLNTLRKFLQRRHAGARWRHALIC
jgi:hypothetical protein